MNNLPVDIDVSEDITDITVVNYRGDTVADVTLPPVSMNDFTASDFILELRGVFHP